MNERIRQLALQAGCDWWEGRAQRDMTRCDTELQKFAELIVRECANICDHQGRSGWNDDRKTQARLDRDLIKQHFGVEE
jgi:hypothetical protein